MAQAAFAVSVAFLAIIAATFGTALDLAIVSGSYNWHGLIDITFELFQRPGAWSLALVWWLLGLMHRHRIADAFRAIARRRLLRVLCCILLAIVSLRVAGDLVPMGSHLDLFCLGTMLGVAAERLLHNGSPFPRQARGILGAALLGGLVYVGFSLIAYGHTMIKATVFILGVPRDDMLLTSDLALLGDGFHAGLAQWRIDHPSLTRSLDVIYVGFLQQLVWSVFYFAGSRDRRSGRRYLFSLFLVFLGGAACYHIIPSVGPIFYRPDLYADLQYLAPDTWRMSRFVYWSTEQAADGTADLVAPFGYIAAMPSLHVGVSVLWVFAMRHHRIAALISTVFVALTFISTTVLGWHYVIDLLVGALIGGFAWAVASHVDRQTERAQLDTMINAAPPEWRPGTSTGYPSSPLAPSPLKDCGSNPARD